MQPRNTIPNADAENEIDAWLYIYFGTFISTTSFNCLINIA